MLGQKFKEARKAKGLTLQQVADETGIPRGTLGVYESGRRRPSEEVREKLCRYYNIIVIDEEEQIPRLRASIDKKLDSMGYDKLKLANAYLKLLSEV